VLSAVAALLPPGVGPGVAALLAAVSFLASATTAALGLGGGTAMLAVLAWVLPPAVLMPVHGIVQLGSNLGRAVVMRRAVALPLLLPFALGSLAGVAAAAPLVLALPTAALQSALGLFVLWATWTPRLKPTRIPAWAYLPVGLATSFATMFVGATGPLVAAFVAPDRLDRHGVVATHAAAMTVQHGLKIGAFALLGFALLPWLPLVALMIAAGFLGTLAGRRTLHRLPERTFSTLFRLVVSALALGLVAAPWTAG
jgi:uncharacterized membrane protein YfcA